MRCVDIADCTQIGPCYRNSEYHTYMYMWDENILQRGGCGHVNVDRELDLLNMRESVTWGVCMSANIPEKRIKIWNGENVQMFCALSLLLRLRCFFFVVVARARARSCFLLRSDLFCVSEQARKHTRTHAHTHLAVSVSFSVSFHCETRRAHNRVTDICTPPPTHIAHTRTHISAAILQVECKCHLFIFSSWDTMCAQSQHWHLYVCVLCVCAGPGGCRSCGRECVL